jgi:hypothetical protein
MKKFFIIGLAVFSLVFCNGCLLFVAGAAAGAGTVVYINGELKDTEDNSLESVHVAAVAAVQDMGFAVVNDTKDVNHALLTVRTSDDKKIEISLIKQSPKLTEIRIRVGTFGDEQLSRQILDKIKSHL